ncbi:MAG: HEAT repeat domain-containing protein [Elusimicrobia bacterium]|nr:HEAT repeat domain-containing protein [Elusimicrobiota bacterium]
MQPKLGVIFWSVFVLYAALFARALATTPNTLRSVPALESIARTGPERARYLAGELLATRGEAGVAALLALAADADLRSRRVGVGGLWRVRPAPKRAVPVLAAAMGAEDVHLRRSAAMALDRQGPQAVEAVPALIKALKDEDPFVRSSARGALAKIGTDDAKAALAKETPR